MLYLNIVLFTFEAFIGLISMEVLNHLHIQSAYRDAVVPATKLVYHNPWVFLVPLTYGATVAWYVRSHPDLPYPTAPHLTRLVVSVAFLIMIALLGALPFVKLYGLLGMPDNA